MREKRRRKTTKQPRRQLIQKRENQCKFTSKDTENRQLILENRGNRSITFAKDQKAHNLDCNY